MPVRFAPKSAFAFGRNHRSVCSETCVRFPPKYTLSKLRAKGLVERIAKTRRYRLTPLGLKLGVLLVKLRMRLLGPLVSLIRQPQTNAVRRPSNPVDAAYRGLDTALDHLSAVLGLKHAA